MSNLVQSTFPIFTDVDGSPLEEGYVYIGIAGLDPVLNPLQAYWDEALSVPASNIRTKGGYSMNSTSPGRLYIGSDYSIATHDKRNARVSTVLNALEVVAVPVAADINITDAGDYFVSTNVESALQEVNGDIVTFSATASITINPSSNNIIVDASTIADALQTLTFVKGAGTDRRNVVQVYNGSEFELAVTDGVDGTTVLAPGTYANYFFQGTDLEQEVSGSAGGGGAKEVGDIFFTSVPYELSGSKWCDYKAISQSTYPSLYEKIGQLYAKDSVDAIAANNAGLFHVPDGHLVVARGGKSWSIAGTDINTSTDQITVTAHGMAVDASDNGRPIKLQRWAEGTPTMPTAIGYAEYDQSYVRVISANTIELYASEAEAINTALTTGRLDWTNAGSGTMMLTTMGTYQGSAMQGHGHSERIGPSASGAGDGYRSKFTGASNLTNTLGSSLYNLSITTPITDTVNGAVNPTNETRMSNVGLGMQIKVSETSVSTGQAYDMLAWGSGWNLCTAWVGQATIPITHGLNTLFDGYLGQIFVRDPSVPGKIWNATDFQVNISNDYGQWLSGITDSLTQCNIQIGFGGPRYNNDGGGGVAIPTTWEYQVKLYKPDLTAVTIPVAGTTYESETGWLSTASWTGGNAISVSHNLGIAFDSLIAHIYVRDPAVPDKIWNGDFTFNEVGMYGQKLNGKDGDLNACYLQMGEVSTTPGRIFTDIGGETIVPYTWEYNVKFYKPNVLDTVVPISSVTYEWDSGWQPIPLSGASTPLTHGLNVEREGLVIEGQVRDGSGNTSDFLLSEAAGAWYGEVIKPNNANSVLLQAAAGGTRGLLANGSTFVVTEYRAIIRKPNILTENVLAVQGQVMTDDLTISLVAGTDWVTVDASAITVADKTLTVSQGGGAGIMNRLKFVGSDTVKSIVTDGTLTFWVEPGQVVDFYLKGTTLMWASGAWETIRDTPTGTDANIVFEVPDGRYSVELTNSTLTYHNAVIVINSNLVTGLSKGVWDSGYTSQYSPSTFAWSTNLAGFYFKKIQKWHNAS